MIYIIIKIKYMNKQKTLIFSLSAMLFLTASFLVYSWSEPTTTMPGTYSNPINTSATAQTKTGEFGASSFTDADDSDYYINPSGNSVVSGKIVMEDSTASTDVPTTVATKGYVDTEIARVESAVNGSLPLVYNMHTREACEVAEGTVVDSDVSLPMCHFDSSMCPTNWTQYKDYSRTTSNSCSTGYSTCGYWGNKGGNTDGCITWSGCTGCTTEEHSWGNIAVESCTMSACKTPGSCCQKGGQVSCSATATRTEIGCF